MNEFEEAKLEEEEDMDNDEDFENENENDDFDEEGDDDSEEEEEGEDEEYVFRFNSGVNPLDLTENNLSGLQTYKQFERLEYEALAERKRKRKRKCQDETNTSHSEENFGGMSMDEFMETFNFGSFRRKSRKLNKKRGRRKGSKKKQSPEVTKLLGEATLHYAYGRFEQAITALNKVILLAPNLPDPYQTLGLIHDTLGDKEKACHFYVFAAILSPKDSSLWKQLLVRALEKGDTGLARFCLDKAIKADPKDISLRFYMASFYVEVGDFERAAESYEQIHKLCPYDIEALRTGAKLYIKCGKTERSVGILEDYLKDHPSEVDLSMVDQLVDILMSSNAHDKALQHIELAHTVYCSGEEVPLNLKIKAGLCHLQLGNKEHAENLLGLLQWENACDLADLITEVADSFMRLEQYNSALKYYYILEANGGTDNGYLYLKIAQCYLYLKEKGQAILYFHKAVHMLEDNIDARLSLASLLLEDGKQDQAITLLSPPKLLDSVDQNLDKSNPWWLNEKIIMKLFQIYRAKGMPEDFIATIFPMVHESLSIEALRRKVRVKRRLPASVVHERAKVLGTPQTDNILCGIRPVAPKSDLVKAVRAKKLLQKRAMLKEEKKALAMAAGVEWHSDDTDDDSPQEVIREPPLPNLLKDEEHQCVIIDLCKALAALRRYEEASDIINLSLRLAYNIMPYKKKDELRSLGAQMAYDSTDPKHGFDCARYFVQQHPYSLAAWNCYYGVISRLGKSHNKHSKFLRYMRAKYKDCAPPLIISGHHFTFASHHQDAARDYLEAYKLLPENPLINLCVGTALINLALGFRLQNKHHCLAQGLAFLYKNLQLCDNSQEAQYNIARACHHVSLVSLAASYYEKVLAIKEKDYPIPKHHTKIPDNTENQESGYCDLRREAAFNLHLIYKKSGAIDLARQVLRDYCTF
ncbi:general transcription factor 3C polypeptide 3 isoform X2 [Mangifera indica]|uniref:general transcription factor 3C polypeptide 3 isoform X2 n=1 Tax=Mangifera indica TaxID=29780 RepID=UPI001CF9D840|nr:general transcription factor 3C polypeptide 3 isoform X2 [Mangifera indica]